ncbi:hypothetical protein [Acetohalobium arabaticum]|uniref:Uncharacterized protein n=1 Tax=Acetohalobium arabaticum (strain ATCC 49924 / DSM 5501 / Z-7288) TaxID=574087 RepID=D9QTC9_ACEAZ|nr:hypothetical protein [Acetohalobium arabaticum]ADL13629.1 hypothetical protein Acear_2141 [Acetohalobium arabaticum DSM 5501]
MSKKAVVFILLIMLLVIVSSGVSLAAQNQKSGWWSPYIGRFNGQWDLSVGTHVWNDHLDLRNLQLRGNMDLAPGLRANMVLRSNEKFDTVDGFDPTFDELYLEKYGFHYGELGTLSASLKVGNMRYLRFPEPDLISLFDQVPGTEDLRFDDAETGYRGEMLTIEYDSKYGLGYHGTGINWDFGSERSGSNLIENYVFYRDKLGKLDLEARAGELQLRHPGGPVERGGRPYHLGRSGPGYSLYLGGNWRGYKAGLLYESIEDEKYDERDTRTGIMVRFAFSKITELLGKVRFDYTRSPEGFVAHIPLLKGRLGDIREEPPENAELVGEIKAERVTTYWQNGQSRNYYEHRLSHWGETGGQDTIVVAETKPWHLRVEALVSPHTSVTSWEEAKEWESDRQGPAQLTQLVTYKFYKVKND